MATTEGALDFEAKALSFLLGQLGAESRLLATEGGVGLASSAGAVYAGAVADLISEDVQPVPTTPYANAKLYQEGLVRAFAESHERVTALLARFSTLYGTGQSFGKKQGLIAHIARSVVRNAAIQIYVPFDTIRDYLIADDAAAGIATGLRALGRSQRIAVKIIASERPTTIAEIVSIFRRIARRPPRIVVSASNLTNLYAPRMVFRSRVLLHASRTPNTSLPIGISRVMRAERDSFVGGSVLHN
jgi:UDP-glucose 4-epimerase